jgi:hypothetical protein
MVTMRRVLSVFLTAVFVLLLIQTSTFKITASSDKNTNDIWDGRIASGFASGNGTKANPYIIETAAQLAYLANKVNTGNNYSGKYFKLVSNIVLNDTSNWKTWGTNSPKNEWTAIGTEKNKFSGIFDGGGHTVSGVYINKTIDYQGLFGYVSNGQIKNIGVIESYIKGGSSVGGIVGLINGTVDNCYNSGEVSGNERVGGVVGWGSGGEVEKCYNIGTVRGTQIYVGGVVGWIGASKIYGCYNTGEIIGAGNCVGGLAGAINNNGVVTSSFNAGVISSGGQIVGGVAGLVYGGVTNCYNTAIVNGKDIVGGIVGYVESSATTTNCYNIGKVNGSGSIGGVAGYISEYSTVINCYYSYGTATGGINQKDVAGKATPLSSSQITLQSSFEGWDFKYEWFMDEKYREADICPSGYPKLQSLGDFSTIPSCAVWDGKTDTVWSGSGTEEDPYLITTAEELAGIAERVNEGITFFGIYFKLTNDIILNDNYEAFLYWQHGAIKWTPIGNRFNTFQGTFDGNGYAIIGLYINTTDMYQGLFGHLLSGTIKNLGIKDSYIKGGNYTGGIVGSVSSGKITKCYNTGTVIGLTSPTGGIAGDISSNSQVSRCSNTGVVHGNRYNVGGIVGRVNNSTVTNCYNSGTIVGTGNCIGGVAGMTENGTVTMSYNTGCINGSVYYTGGIVGDVSSNSTVENCYNIGTISGNRSTGGVAGYVNDSTVTKCHNVGNVKGVTSSFGNIAGYVTASGIITRCYYFNGNIRGIGVGEGQAIYPNKAQMQLQSYYNGWDFEETWSLGEVAGYYYPILRNAIDVIEPQIASVTSSSVILTPVEGYEYRCNNKPWQDSNVFTSLSPNTTYSFSQRMKKTSTTCASGVSDAIQVKTLKNPAPAAPVSPIEASKTSTSVTLVRINGYEYRCRTGAWQDSNVFTGLTPNAIYTFYQRVKETSTTYASEESPGIVITTPKNPAPAAPEPPTESSKTATTITLTLHEGYEYKCNDGEWQDSNVYENLVPDTEYSFYQRIKETNKTYGSEPSLPSIIRTDPKEPETTEISLDTTNEKPEEKGCSLILTNSIVFIAIIGCALIILRQEKSYD